MISCCLLVAFACVSQGRICSDSCTCSHSETEVAYQTFYLSQLWNAISPSADLLMSLKYHGESGNRTQVCRSRGGRLTSRLARLREATDCQWLQTVSGYSGYRLSVATVATNSQWLQWLQTVSGYRLSVATVATDCQWLQWLQIVSGYRLSVATDCQWLQWLHTVSCYRLSVVTDCQWL